MANPFRTNNPVLKESAFRAEIATGQTMTIQGTVNKAGILLLCVVIAARVDLGLEPFSGTRGFTALDVRRGRRRTRYGTGDHLQEKLVSANVADLRLA